MCPFAGAACLPLCVVGVQNARVNLASLDADVDFLKDQITVSEVNIARVHNYNVALKKEAREAAGPSALSTPASGGAGQVSKRGILQAAGTITAGGS
jgi:hypothetical protein